jgi:hypothetical protein
VRKLAPSAQQAHEAVLPQFHELLESVALALITGLKQVLTSYLGPLREATARRPARPSSLFDRRGAAVERKGRPSSKEIRPYPPRFTS